MNEGIDMRRIGSMIKQKLFWVLTYIITPVILMFLYITFLATPIYQKSTQILVSQSEESQRSHLDVQTIQADLQLINTYSTIILSPRILIQVQENLNLNYTLDELSNMIEVRNANNSQVIDLVVNNSDPRAAEEIADLTAKVFAEEISEIMRVDNVTILTEAQYSGTGQPIRPQRVVMMVLSLFVGICLAFAYIFIKLILQKTFVDTDELEKMLDMPLLGGISSFPEEITFQNREKKNSDPSQKDKNSDYSIITEQFKLVRASIDFSRRNQNMKTIMVTSPESGTGKSTITLNLAVTYAQRGERTLVIDADMRRPTLHKQLSKNNDNGLSNVVLGEENLENCIHNIVLKDCELSFLSSGPLPINPNDLLDSHQMVKLLTGIKEQYDVILIDTPPINVVSDALVLSNLCDGSILACRYQKTVKKKALEAVKKLRLSGGKIIGVIFNGTNDSDEYYY